MGPLLLAVIGLIATSAAAIALEISVMHKVQCVELTFGRDITPDVMKAVVDRLAGLHRGARVALDVVADHDGIHHLLRSDEATIDTLRASLRALIPTLRLAPVPPGMTPEARFTYGRSLQLRGRLGVIREDLPVETATALLAAMQPLGKGERLLLRWVIRSARPLAVPANGQSAVESEERRRVRAKNQSGIIRARGIIAVHTGHPQRAAHLLARVNSVLRARATAYGRLTSVPRWRVQLAWDLEKRTFLLMDRYSSAEFAPLLAWPVAAPVLPGLQLGTSPQRIPSASIPSKGGLVLGTATWPGLQRPIVQPITGALSHSLYAGPTGVGKSTLITNLVVDQMQSGRAVCLLDGKGDTVSAVLERVPQGRERDVVVLDCAETGSQPGIRLFGDGEPELAADVVLGVLSDLFKDNWGVLSERYLRAALVAVSHDPHGTLAEVPYVYSDAGYRRKLVGQLQDSVAKATLLGLEEMSAADRQHQLSSSFNKLSTLLGRPIIRTVLGQAEPKLDFSAALSQRKIVLISINPMRVGAAASRLVGAIVVYALFQAVQKRIALPAAKRHPVLVFVDEPKALGDLPIPLDALLEQARGLGVGIGLAPQGVTQLPKSIRDAALTNVGTRVVFRQNADDAQLLARDLAGVSADDLGELGPFEAVARIALSAGNIAPPVTIKTAPVAPPTSDAAVIRSAASERWGRSLEEVDEALNKRHNTTTEQVPVGRRRRQT